MPEEDFWKEYHKIVQEHRERMQMGEMEQEQEKRVYPRLQVDPKSLWSESLPEAEVDNISATGVAIRANQPREIGELILVSLGNTLSVEAEVVGCRMTKPPDEYVDGEFMIQCRFLEDLKAIELVVKSIRKN